MFLPESKFSFKSFLRSFLLALYCVSAALMADDTEIFFGQAASTDDSNPNILFILDSSGSMKEFDPDTGGLSRMDRLKDAMNSLIDQSSSFNVGFMSFNGSNGGGPVRYPIGYLEGVSGSDCPEAGCPDEIVVSRPRSSADDAVENKLTGEVALNSTNLAMGNLDSGTVDTGIPGDAVLIDGEAAIQATVTEALRLVDTVTINQNDQATDNWFYKLGAVGEFTAQQLGYRFGGVSIPPGAVVTAASIELTVVNALEQVGNVSAYISAEAVAVPATYPDASLVPTPDPNPLLADRTLSNKFVSWPDIIGSLPGEVVSTPDLKEILQEVIGLPDWAAGNDMSFIIEPFDNYEPSLLDQRLFHGFGALSDIQKPILKYSYYIPSGTDAGTVTATASEHIVEYLDPVSTLYGSDAISPTSDLFYQSAAFDATEYALRFDNIEIPDGAVITGAYLTMTNAGGTGTFSANIAAQLSATPSLFAGEPLNTRSSTLSFKELTLEDAAAGEISSPDLTELIDEIRALPSWTTGGSIVFQLTPGAGYVHDGTLVRSYETSTGTNPPILNISWQKDESAAGTEIPTNLTGLRFPNVHIPPEATIVSATIEFQSNTASDSVVEYEIRGEATNNAEEFNSTNLDISLRPKTLAGVAWTAEPWPTVGTKHSSVDISTIVQELVDQSDWCGGNAIAMLIDTAATGIRDAVSFEASKIDAPALKITYAPESVPTGSYCSNRSSVVAIDSAADDATEVLSGGNVALTSTSLDLVDASGEKSIIGLRFRGVPIPQGTNLVNAVVELTAASDIAGGAAATISAEAIDDSPALLASTDNLSARTNGAQTVSWNNIPAVSAGDSVFTPNITAVVDEIINRPGWVEGNSITVKISADIGGAINQFGSYDGSEATAARLVLYYQGERSAPGTLFKENLKNAINELEAEHGTPIVDAYLEGVNYYLGRAVDYGAYRGYQGASAPLFRVSHPSSYTGGTLNQPGACSNADLNHNDCKLETISGNPVYISPITNQCQQNHIVLLSDGAATSNSSASKVRSLIGQNGLCKIDGAAAADDHSSDQSCGRELATWLSTNDLVDLIPGDQRIITHTIGFNLDDPTFLEDLADKGNGSFYPASTAADLLVAFKNIFNSVSKTDTSFVAPSTTVNQFNRLRNREDVYFSLFKPESTARWSGNLKRYKLLATNGQTADIVDATDTVAVDPVTSEFVPGSRSFWSSTVDGGVVNRGGAAGEFEGSSARKIVTFADDNTDLMAVENRLTTGNLKILTSDFELPPDKEADADYVDRLILWAAGKDVDDEDSDGITDENRIHIGDPLHSEPVVLNYTPNGTTPVSAVFMSTNEGYLHAFDHATGAEHFAFIPKVLFKNLRYFYDNDVAETRRYGLDGGMTSWIIDVDHDGVIDAADGDKAYLYIGMRRGGRNYYALDVTNPANPRYMWSIKGEAAIDDLDDTTANGDYTDLGQTWSKPVKSRITDGDTVKDVLIFGGGYDPNNHDAVGDTNPGLDVDGHAKEDFLATAIYVADALTGELLWTIDHNDPDYAAMLYSIPSDIRVLDINTDGLADQLYFGDLGGQVWRIDINNSVDASLTLDNRITGGLIADFGNSDGTTGATNRRRFYAPPDISIVAINGIQYLSVSIGSGWRAHPLDTDVQDKFYTFRLPNVYGPPLDTMGQIVYNSIDELTSGMVDVTDTLGADPSTTLGWYLDLERPGEKALSGSLTIDRSIIFTTYTPAAAADGCDAVVGTGRIYIVDALNGDPKQALSDSSTSGNTSTLGKVDRSRLLRHAGIPPPASILFPENGKPTVMLGTEKLIEVEMIPKGRTFWREHLDEDS